MTKSSEALPVNRGVTFVAVVLFKQLTQLEHNLTKERERDRVYRRSEKEFGLIKDLEAPETMGSEIIFSAIRTHSSGEFARKE